MEYFVPNLEGGILSFLIWPKLAFADFFNLNLASDNYPASGS